jgi:hypothetical protein
MVDMDARRRGNPKEPRSFKTGLAVNHNIVGAKQEGYVEPEGADRIGDLAYVGSVGFPQSSFTPAQTI